MTPEDLKAEDEFLEVQAKAARERVAEKEQIRWRCKVTEEHLRQTEPRRDAFLEASDADHIDDG